jgi:hypothetical protein
MFINFREPNVDRFLEIASTAHKLNYNVNYEIFNAPMASHIKIMPEDIAEAIQYTIKPEKK